MKLPIHERFATWQGEGVHVGRRAFFIRTLGCPIKCPFCDSAGTWHPDWIPKENSLMSPADLVDEAKVASPEFIVLTGGEPTIFDLTELTRAASIAAIPIHLETSGAFFVKGVFNWITVSPKRWGQLHPHTVVIADEFKFIIQKPEDIAFYLGMISSQTQSPLQKPIWLHPEWSQRDNPEVLGAISDAVVRGDRRFRAGYQLHKLYKVDARDPRSAKLVPLGGEPSNGY